MNSESYGSFTKRSYRFWMSFSIVFFVLGFLSFVYVDTTTFTRWGIAAGEVTLKGNPRDFFRYCMENFAGTEAAIVGGGYLNRIPAMIWNIPSLILLHMTGKSLEELPGIFIWNKGLPLLFSLLLMQRLPSLIACFGLKKEDYKELLLYMIGGLALFSGVAFAGQTDIIEIYLGVLAVEAYMKKKDKYFFLFSALSIMMKPFFIFHFLALLFLREKRIFPIIWGILKAVSLFLISNLILIGSANTPAQSLAFRRMYAHFTKTVIPTSMDGISIFLLFLVLIYFYAFQKREEEAAGESVLVLLEAITVMLLLFGDSPLYRIIMLLPYHFLLIWKKEEDRKTAIFCTSLFFLGLMAFSVTHGKYFLSTENIQYGLPGWILGGSSLKIRTGDMLFHGKRMVYALQNILTTIGFGSMLFLTFRICVLSKKESAFLFKKTDRMIIDAFYFILPVIYFLIHIFTL